MSEHTNPQASHDNSGTSWGIVSLAFLVALCLVLGMAYAAFFQPMSETENSSERAVAERLLKVGTVDFTPMAAASGAADADVPVGEALYKKSCSVCHASGTAGAPKFGDKDEWAPRIATGMDSLLKVAIAGKGGMPARGATTASDEDLKAAIEYMVEHSK